MSNISTKVPEEKSQKIRASVLHGVRDLRIEGRFLFPPNPGMVQVAIRTTGLCGSDLHYYNHYRNGDIIVQEPLSLGHESAGVITKVGDGVTNVKVGDKVALEVGLPCGQCERCQEGRYNICKGMKFRSSAKSFPHSQGTLQDRINHPSGWVHKLRFLLPDGMSLDLGALLEPLGVAIHAERRAKLVPGSKVLVFGAGTVGLLSAAVAKIKGASTVAIADIDEGRVNFATQNGFADIGYTVPLKRGSNIEENLEIARATAEAIGTQAKKGGDVIGEVDTVFECTGVPSCVQAGIYATRPGGRLMLIGMGSPIQTLPVSAAALREVDLVGVFRYANTYPEGIEILSRKDAGYPDFSKLVTHRFQGLDNAPEAFDMAAKTKDRDGKLVLKVMLETKEDGKAQL
ncbi:sorbitol dehydrogenase-like protein [Rhizodiscina lignyota]|uniref:Sorbitol dehydrogenase-like protein n=1 Tax=Rhizodiscina lignyota TaxID=1504668 RepID=A0A9P4I7M5_9PEZI|nr:sorbitol dehydrogenase-like protein [Rhizodiscina lignyota]